MKDNERKYIVTNDGKPMTFESSQHGNYFYYVGPIRHGYRDAVHTYTKAEAKRFIRLAKREDEIEGRQSLNYKLMRIKP